jgi:glutamate synthase domain-containing protein 1
MCGQCGILLAEPGPVGTYLREMETAMVHRGPDSTGFALYGPPPPDDRVVVRARIADAGRADETVVAVADAVRGTGCGLVGDFTLDDNGPAATDRFARFAVRLDGVAPERVLAAIEAVEGVYVHSMGRRLEIVKDVGSAEVVARRHRIDDFVGTHGLAHSRLATESIVDVEYSHPFWARPFLDVAIVHNGQITNYYKMRRQLQARGLEFLTENDSELIAVLIAEQLAEGVPLDEALRRSVDVLDGVFTYLLATENLIGCALDRLAIKPIVVTERPGLVAMATEEQALRRILRDEIETYHPREGTTAVWGPARMKGAA